MASSTENVSRPIEVLLRRDRLVVAGALAVMIALAWAYILWLAAMSMPPISMSADGWRMIPAGIGIMAPAAAPWTATCGSITAGAKARPTLFASVQRS
jgi:predicted metal-binding membrane protein